MADLTTLLSKFLNALYAGTLYSNPLGATSVGVPVIQAVGRTTAQTAAVASVATFTVGASDGTFEVSANLLATVSTSYSFDVTVAYTDESNTARTIKLNMMLTGGNLSNSVALTNANGPLFQGLPMHIRCKAATTITVATAGTFTTITYNVEGIIKQVA